MRSISTFSVPFFLFLFINLIDARKNPEDYWKSMMKGEPMPKSIKDLVHLDPPSLSNIEKEDHELHTASKTINMNRFIKDFDIRPSVIIYHGHVEPKDVKPYVKDFKPEGEKTFAKPVKPGLIVPEYNIEK
ncbi:hypothetical protein F0562_028594 [Nyssa sinensis]|uniref:Organ specific protein n=1 Tax=Nyssa sinensis TaxID=561372 RepID=A0A5J5B1Q9_9ASTE|nr:hypothetical protein F0562_028594 [Nyssa sinensis]